MAENNNSPELHLATTYHEQANLLDKLGISLTLTLVMAMLGLLSLTLVGSVYALDWFDATRLGAALDAPLSRTTQNLSAALERSWPLDSLSPRGLLLALAGLALLALSGIFQRLLASLWPTTIGEAGRGAVPGTGSRTRTGQVLTSLAISLTLAVALAAGQWIWTGMPARDLPEAPLLLSALTAIIALSLATALLFWDAAPEFYTRISLLMAALFAGLSITLLSLLTGQILPYIAPLPSELLLVLWLFAITLLLLTAQQIAVALNRPGLIAPPAVKLKPTVVKLKPTVSGSRNAQAGLALAIMQRYARQQSRWIPVETLAEALAADLGSLSVVLDRLEAEGLLRRAQLPEQSDAWRLAMPLERIALVTLLDAFGANLEEVLAESSDPRGSLDRRDNLNEMRDGIETDLAAYFALPAESATASDKLNGAANETSAPGSTDALQPQFVPSQPPHPSLADSQVNAAERQDDASENAASLPPIPERSAYPAFVNPLNPTPSAQWFRRRSARTAPQAEPSKSAEPDASDAAVPETSPNPAEFTDSAPAPALDRDEAEDTASPIMPSETSETRFHFGAAVTREKVDPEAVDPTTVDSEEKERQPHG
jgi:DNA-binding MarR family transcriptional regulator